MKFCYLCNKQFKDVKSYYSHFSINHSGKDEIKSRREKFLNEHYLLNHLPVQISGLATIWDFGKNIESEVIHWYAEIDNDDSIKSDWVMTGKDIDDGIEKFEDLVKEQNIEHERTKQQA